MKGRTLVYTKNEYRGYFDSKTLVEWKKYGRTKRMKYLYKGYRHSDIPREGNEPVCKFSTKKWGATELAKQKANGFLGIRSYVC